MINAPPTWTLFTFRLQHGTAARDYGLPSKRLFSWRDSWDREMCESSSRPHLGEAKDVWRNAAHPALQNRLKDLSWMVAHEILPVRAVMHSRGMAKNPHCPRSGCGSPGDRLPSALGVRCCAGPVGQDQPPGFPVPAGGSGPGGIQARHPGGGSGLEGANITAIYLALAHPQPYQGCHLGHQKPAGGKRVTVPLHACEQLVRSAALQEAPDVVIRMGGLGSHQRGPGHPRPWPPVDAPSPHRLREQRASGPEERGSPLGAGSEESGACSGDLE
ncbi:hypothetical protein F2P79_023213 [Pimephales promelas]|nr:hypothetical protein F2P79_023213 [Pimephales promelas]